MDSRKWQYVGLTVLAIVAVVMVYFALTSGPSAPVNIQIQRN